MNGITSIHCTVAPKHCHGVSAAIPTKSLRGKFSHGETIVQLADIGGSKLIDLSISASGKMELSAYGVGRGSLIKKISSSNPFPSGKWVHVAVALGGHNGENVMYWDGEDVGSQNFDGRIHQSILNARTISLGDGFFWRPG